MRVPVNRFSFRLFILTLRLTPAWSEPAWAKEGLTELSQEQLMGIPVVGARLEKMPLLTVNGSDRLLEAGGVIGLIVEDSKIRFYINLSAVRRNSQVLFSSLLELVRQVRQP